MSVRNARKRVLQLEPLERRELLSSVSGSSFSVTWDSRNPTVVSEGQSVVLQVNVQQTYGVRQSPVTVVCTAVQKNPAGVFDNYLVNATPGLDYVLGNGSPDQVSLTFQPSETSKTFTIQTSDNSIVQPSRYIKLWLTIQGSGGFFGGSQISFVRIADNDAKVSSDLPSADLMQGFLKGQVFWQPASNYSSDAVAETSGNVIEFSNFSQGYDFPVKDGVTGRAVPFTWGTYLKEIASSTGPKYFPAVFIQLANNESVDYFSLSTAKNDTGSVAEWWSSATGDKNFGDVVVGFWEPIDSLQVPAAVRTQFLLNLAISDQWVNAGGLLTLTAQATGSAAGDRLTYSLDPGAPPRAMIDPKTGAFSWAVPATQPGGKYPVTIRVTDIGVTDNGGLPLSATATFTITVNGTPTLMSEQRLYVGKGRKRTLVFQLNFSTALNAAVVQNTGHYSVVQVFRAATKKRPAQTKRISVRAAQYNPGNSSVTLTLGKYTALNKLQLTATGLISATGTPAATIVTRL